MKYTLMHKDVRVAGLDIDEATGSIQKIDELYDAAHLPVGIPLKKGIADRAALNEWWADRSIPASRSGIRTALETLHLQSTKMLLTRCLGLSLSDQYWIRPQDSPVAWSKVNFFDNDFSEDIGNVLLGKAVKSDNFDFHSPDNTSDGYLKKRWKIIDGKRCLIKAGSNPFMQQPMNEVIASKIMKRLGISHVQYELMWDDGIPYSVCEDFITPDTELVSAWRVMQTQKKDNSTSVYRHYLNCCEQLGVRDIAQDVDRMIVVDYLTANEDRHQNNFGLVRDANTLKWLGAAPIFDSGSSLGYDKLTGQIVSGEGIECKPFKKTHEEQLKLVTSFDWIDFDSLKDVDKEILSVLNGAGEFMDEARKDAIAASVTKRIGHLKELALSRHQVIDDTESDVERDVAEDYGIKFE